MSFLVNLLTTNYNHAFNLSNLSNEWNLPPLLQSVKVKIQLMILQIVGISVFGKVYNHQLLSAYCIILFLKPCFLKPTLAILLDRSTTSNLSSTDHYIYNELHNSNAINEILFNIYIGFDIIPHSF